MVDPLHLGSNETIDLWEEIKKKLLDQRSTKSKHIICKKKKTTVSIE